MKLASALSKVEGSANPESFQNYQNVWGVLSVFLGGGGWGNESVLGDRESVQCCTTVQLCHYIQLAMS
jgi:hypothetical protein